MVINGNSYQTDAVNYNWVEWNTVYYYIQGRNKLHKWMIIQFCYIILTRLQISDMKANVELAILNNQWELTVLVHQ